MNTVLKSNYSHGQLRSIIEQAFIYQCACPAQVAKQLSDLQHLYNYQMACVNETGTDAAVHKRIAESVERSYAELEQCMTDVLILEGWNLETLKMPDYLQKRLVASIESSE